MNENTRDDQTREDAMYENACRFCERIKNGAYVYSNLGIVAFPPLNPVVPGHYLIVPRIHVADALQDPGVFGDAMEFAAEVGLLRGVLAANFITSVGSAATQTVFHLHIHLVPREEGDGLLLPWSNQH
jgi:histidine triad (HIT) family protein